MNNIFNLQRFLWLFSKHTKENFKAYLMSTLLLIGMLIFIMAYCGYAGFLGSGPQSGVFYTSLLLGGSIFTSSIFAELSNKRKSITTLTLPVSHFERFLVGWIYSFIILQIVLVACFYLVDFAMISFINSNSKTRYDIVNVFSSAYGGNVILFIFWVLHALMLSGSLYFKKLHFVKTALVFFALIVVCTAGNKLLVRSILGDQFSAILPFSDVWYRNEYSMYNLNIFTTYYKVLILGVFVVSCCIWIAAYFKMKEKQA